MRGRNEAGDADVPGGVEQVVRANSAQLIRDSECLAQIARVLPKLGERSRLMDDHVGLCIGYGALRRESVE